MSEPLRIVAVVGSLRRDSFTRRIVRALAPLAPDSMLIEEVAIGSLPLYNEDDDLGAPPPAWQAFRERIAAADAVLFATPEYNRSIPGALKNAIDVGSRPYGASVWNGKPAAVLSASPGALGGFGANHHLRQCLVFLNVPVMQQPEAYLGQVDQLVGEQARIQSNEAAAFLTQFCAAFEQWILRIQGKPRSTQDEANSLHRDVGHRGAAVARPVA